MEFDQVIAPLKRDAFISDYWGKHWLHLPGTAGRFAELLGWDELNLLLEYGRMVPPHIRLSKDGQIIDQEGYTSKPPGAGHAARIDPARLVALLSEGATLVLQGVEEIVPRVRALSDSFRDAFRCRNHVNLYASWHSEKGFDLHWDSHEVMVLQLHGRKNWQIHAPTLDFPLDMGSAPKPSGAPLWEGLLNPGDILYLPRGFWHVAHAIHEPSMHLTFGIAPLNGVNMLNWMAARLRGSARFRQDLPLLEGAAAVRAHIAGLQSILADAFTEQSLDDFQHEAGELDHARPPIQLPQAPYRQREPLRDDCLIRLGSSRLALKDEGDRVSFMAYGKNYSVPAYVKPALVLLNGRQAIPFHRLCAALENDAAVASLKQGLAILARAGVVLVEAP